jgi:hypothetical protein
MVSSPRIVSERIPIARCLRRVLSPRTIWVAFVVACGGPEPANTSDAPARPLLVVHGRTSVHNVLSASNLVAASSSGGTHDDPQNAVDGRDDTAWTGSANQSQWRLTLLLARPAHVGLLRTHWGQSPTRGVPTIFQWEVLRPRNDGTKCDSSAENEESWAPLRGTEQSALLWGDLVARPTRRSWFVNETACGLRLVVDRANAGPPVVREMQAIESASDVLEGGRGSDDGAYPGFRADSALDGAYGTRWAGAPGKSRWTLRVDLREREVINRVRLVLGIDSTGVARRPTGRGYAVAWAPIHYVLEASEDGAHFDRIAYEPVRSDGTVLPLRRRLITLPEPRPVTALRLTITGASAGSGLAEPSGVPVVRELAAFRADDERPILAAPWILSVNANPSAQSHRMPGGEAADDAHRAKFLQTRLRVLLPALRNDDPVAFSSDGAGAALESIEGDDPQLDAQLLGQSSPPPIIVLSGSNDWDYAADTAPDPAHPTHWHWNPLRDAGAGGMGRLAPAIQNRVAPFLGFCGGAQILALLEARRPGPSSVEDDLHTIDRVLQRTSGYPIRGFAPSIDVERAWPGDQNPGRATVDFRADDELFSDMAGSQRRSKTRALPEWHIDAVRPDAFLRGGSLERFDLVATSAFCTPDVAVNPRASIFRDLRAATWCATVPQAFRSRDQAWPVIGAQFHAEQRDFVDAAPGDPPESVADPRLFLAAAYEEIVDAYERFAP